jgi:hypothetical protein
VGRAGKLYLLDGKASELSALAGQKLTINGQLQGNTLTVSSVAAAQ